MDTAIKTGIDAVKNASKRVVQKTAQTAGNKIGNKIANKVTSVGKTKSKEKEDETNEIEEIYIPSEKRQQIIDALRQIFLATYLIKYLNLLLKCE